MRQKTEEKEQHHGQLITNRTKINSKMDIQCQQCKSAGWGELAKF